MSLISGITLDLIIRILYILNSMDLKFDKLVKLNELINSP